jgi:hypothetical protein
VTLLVVDNSALDYVEAGPPAERFASNCRAAGLVPAVTEINLLEAVAAPERRTKRVLSTLRGLADGKPVLPWTFQLLVTLGHAIVNGIPVVTLDPSGKEWLLDDTAEAATEREAVVAFNRRMNDEYESFHRGQRRRIQSGMKRRGLRGQIAHVRDFFEYWEVSPARTEVFQLVWGFLGLPGPGDITAATANDVWRMFLDVEGYALFEYAIKDQQRSVPQRFDLLQIPYLGIGQGGQRIIATEDGAFLTAADEILRGRYTGARAVHIDQLTG